MAGLLLISNRGAAFTASGGGMSQYSERAGPRRSISQ